MGLSVSSGLKPVTSTWAVIDLEPARIVQCSGAGTFTPLELTVVLWKVDLIESVKHRMIRRLIPTRFGRGKILFQELRALHILLGVVSAWDFLRYEEL